MVHHRPGMLAGVQSLHNASRNRNLFVEQHLMYVYRGVQKRTEDDSHLLTINTETA